VEWTVILPVAVSACVILLLYLVPPPWVKKYLGTAEEITQAIAAASLPETMGDAVHHALTKNDGEVMQELGEHLNGVVAENVPTFTKALAGEAVAALSVMTTPGQARALKDKSGAAKGYLNLGGSIQRQAVRTGAESMAGGALGEIMSHPVYGPLAQQFIQDALTKKLGGGNGGQPQQQQQLPIGGSPI